MAMEHPWPEIIRNTSNNKISTQNTIYDIYFLDQFMHQKEENKINELRSFAKALELEHKKQNFK